MKFKQFIKNAIILIFVYKIGEIAGNIHCFNDFVDKHGDVLFEKDDVVTYDINDNCTICRVKPTEEGDK